MNAPPLLISFESVDALLGSIPVLTREACEQEIRDLVGRGLPPAVSTRTVSALFGVSAEFVGALSRAPQRYYRVFRIKKGKKTREIQAPRVALKVIQKWLGFHIARSITMPKSVFGFIPGKGVIDAAREHCEARWIYSFDLRDFFPSISADQVRAALRELGYSERSATLITCLCTPGGKLPQGSPASPVLSNLVFVSTDVMLQSLADELGVRYSRYADDLVFSGKTELPDSLVARTLAILVHQGWRIAEEKVHLAKLPARLKVHGLLVHQSKPRLTKGYRNRIRAFRHLIATEKIRTEDVQKIRGHLSYANLVEKS